MNDAKDTDSQISFAYGNLSVIIKVDEIFAGSVNLVRVKILKRLKLNVFTMFTYSKA